ncbi:MAG: hypothetical protein J5733_11210, partial [Bacteroidaceae bacterium]|nr:hypothetical protein [Bacteroidaceae bacterium]
MRILLSVVFSLLSMLCAQAQSPVSYTQEDSLRVVELLEKGSKELPLKGDGGAATLFYANQLMSLPYVAHTLEIRIWKSTWPSTFIASIAPLWSRMSAP